MTDLTTDERLSGQLLPVLADLQESAVRYQQNAEVLRQHLSTYAARVQEMVEQRSSESADRLAQLVEGLAAGTVRIVDEGRLLQVAESYIVLHGDGSTPAHLANLMLEELNTSGALR